MFSGTLQAEKKLNIFNEYTLSDTVDFGMCMPGQKLISIFNIQNLGKEEIKMLGFAPTYGVFIIKGHPGEQSEFDKTTSVPFFVSGSQLKKFYMKFDANSSQTTPPRKNTARLRLGLFNPKLFDIPADTNQLVGFRDFIIIARKTIHYIDVFEKLIDFDSVYIYPKDTVRKQMIVQNSSKFPLEVFNVKYQRSLNAEITTTVMDLPLKFSKYNTNGFQHVWDFAYYPRNMGLDTAVLKIMYKPDPINFPDSVDVRSTIIHGIGVQQDLGVINAEGAKSFSFNNLDFGDLEVGKTKTIKFVVRTIGNISFGALSQKILRYDSNLPGDGFTIERKMVDTTNLQPFMTDTMIVRFTPTRSDTFRARLVIESDIIKRHIIGYPDSVRYRTIILEGVGRQAEIATMPKEINFGNIVVNESGDCPTRRDTLIPVSNIGNLSLLVHSRVLPDNSRNPFKVKPGFITIPGRETKYILLRFDSTIKRPGYFNAELYIISNSPEEKDTLISKLVARGIYPDTMDISIPKNIRSKPGRRISIPILIDKSKAGLSRIFVDTITYNKSILYFNGVRKVGTASEFCDVRAVQSTDNGALALEIKTLGSERFLPRDTLIVLEFDTFLGSTEATSLHFVNPKFSDGICARILSLNRSDGAFRLDSVCGLKMKTAVQHQNGVRFKTIAPNPANTNVRIIFELDGEYKTNINLYNTFGEKVVNLMSKTMKKGIHSGKYDFGNLPPGLYFIEVRAGIYKQTERLIITY